MRLRGRRSELQPSWTTCHQQWTMQYRNAAESTNWKMFASDLESHQMNSSTVSGLLLIDATSQQKMKKERNVQYRFVRALSDKELVKKLLALDLTATTAKMLEVCHTHIAISDNLEAMGLKEQKTVNAIRRHNKPHQGKKPPTDSAHSCGCCTRSHPPGRSSCPARDDHCRGCGKLGHWKPKCRSGQKGPKDKGPKHLNRGGKQRKVNEVGTDEDPHYDEIGIRTIELSDVWIDSTTEAFATVEMPAEIGPNKLATLKCKVDTGAGGNVMPLRAFAKLFPPGVLTPMVHQED